MTTTASSNVMAQLQQILDGALAGQPAADTLRLAISSRNELQDQAQSMAETIRRAEDFLIYGPPGRPGVQSYR